MTVDGSYMAWVRPTRRVHFALSAGMTVTGVILIVLGAPGGRAAVRPSPLLGRAADSVVSHDDGSTAGASGGLSSLLPPAPLVRFGPPDLAAPQRNPKPHARPHSQPHSQPQPQSQPQSQPQPQLRPRTRHTVPSTPTAPIAPQPSDVSHLRAPTPAPPLPTPPHDHPQPHPPRR